MARFKHSPIERHEALTPFSRDHYTGLVQDAAAVRQIRQAIDEHIRWEERELFVRLQDQLSDEQLAELGHPTEPIEQPRPRSTCRPGSENKGDAAR